MSRIRIQKVPVKIFWVKTLKFFVISVSRILIQDPVPFWPWPWIRDRKSGSGIKKKSRIRNTTPNFGTGGSKDLFRCGGGEDVESPGWQGAGWADQQELWLGPRTARRLENGLTSRQGGYLQQQKIVKIHIFFSIISMPLSIEKSKGYVYLKFT